ncbi:MAG: uroporphyrinogen-III synthase, partial [Pseudomonadota bacterium]
MRGFVLVTRPAEDAGRTLAALRRRGCHAIAAPVLNVQTLSAPVPDIGMPDAVIFTSGNAVRSAMKVGFPAEWRALPALAVGDRTAVFASKAGFERVDSARGDRHSLSRLCGERLAPDRHLLHVTGSGLGRDLDRTLEDQGHRISRWECYTTRPISRFDNQTRWLIGRGRVGGALLLSPRSAAAFASLLVKHGLWPGSHKMAVGCISKATANALLDSAGPNPLLTLCIAQRPDLNSTIDALLS